MAPRCGNTSGAGARGLCSRRYPATDDSSAIFVKSSSSYLDVMRFPMRWSRIGIQTVLFSRMSRLPGSVTIDVEQQFPVFSDGTPPLFRQAPHFVDQRDRVVLVNRYPLFFHTVSETGRAEALVCFHVVQNSPAVFNQKACLSPYWCSSLAAPTLAARSCNSTINFSGSIKQDECASAGHSLPGAV